MLRVDGACTLTNIAFLGARSLATRTAVAIAVVTLGRAVSVTSRTVFHVARLIGWSGRKWLPRRCAKQK
jgi:hypothetical protein